MRSSSTTAAPSRRTHPLRRGARGSRRGVSAVETPCRASARFRARPSPTRTRPRNLSSSIISGSLSSRGTTSWCQDTGWSLFNCLYTRGPYPRSWSEGRRTGDRPSPTAAYHVTSPSYSPRLSDYDPNDLPQATGWHTARANSCMWSDRTLSLRRVPSALRSSCALFAGHRSVTNDFVAPTLRQRCPRGTGTGGGVVLGLPRVLGRGATGPGRVSSSQRASSCALWVLCGSKLCRCPVQSRPALCP